MSVLCKNTQTNFLCSDLKNENKSIKQQQRIQKRKRFDPTSYAPKNYHILNELRPLNISENNNPHLVTSESESIKKSSNDIPICINHK